VSGAAICARCGDYKARYDQVCPGCGHRPAGDGLLVAWLLSEHHVPAGQLPALAERVRRGEAIRPSDRVLDLARSALHRNLSTDEGLGRTRVLAFALVSLVLTPLPALVLAAWWRSERPRSALQALVIGVSVSAFSAALSLRWLLAP